MKIISLVTTSKHAHRVGKKGSTIVKFMNRTFAEVALYNGKQLKDTAIYGPRNKVYNNNSFCKEFAHINYYSICCYA